MKKTMTNFIEPVRGFRDGEHYFHFDNNANGVSLYFYKDTELEDGEEPDEDKPTKKCIGAMSLSIEETERLIKQLKYRLTRIYEEKVRRM
jgi:hypothetical protein